jgi:hypothetical protein
MTTESHQPVFEDQSALLIVKLMTDLDCVILELRRVIRPQHPWQRKLLALAARADRQMQVLRMTEAMGKDDAEIVDASNQLGATCQEIALALRGSRAPGSIKSMATLVSAIGAELARLLKAEGAAHIAGQQAKGLPS